MGKKSYDRDVLALDDTQLEKFVLDWVNSKTASYVESTRFSGAGDMGRDVVGFLTKNKHEGAWDNYQCKQYANSLPTNTALCEIGKILYYAHLKEFTVPLNYFFVVPKGVNRNLETLIFNPSQFKEKLISEWGKYCAAHIIENQSINLDPPLKAFIENYDFSSIHRLKLDDILNDPVVTPVLYKWFGADPGPAPKGTAPSSIAVCELPYINQLIDAYGQREGVAFSDHDDVAKHGIHSEHLSVQRERYYDADAFKRFYRDNTDKNTLDIFESDIYHGIFDTYKAKHSDALDRVDAVMTQAANLTPSGPLAQHARIPVKQGICHHFANDGKVKWKK
jgi:hypothetical protein